MQVESDRKGWRKIIQISIGMEGSKLKSENIVLSSERARYRVTNAENNMYYPQFVHSDPYLSRRSGVVWGIANFTPGECWFFLKKILK